MPAAAETALDADSAGEPGSDTAGAAGKNRATRLISVTKTATKSIRKGPGLLGGQASQPGRASQASRHREGAEVPAGSAGQPRQQRAHTMANRALANSLNTRPTRSRLLVNPHLRKDPRLKVWITRAVVAVVILLGLTIGVSWRIGLTAAVIYVAADSVFRSKTTAPVPAGVRVTSAQRFTRRRLRVLQPAGYMALHARTIPGTRHVIDHVVIGPAGVFTVDSQRLDRRLPLRAIGGMLYHGRESMEPRFDHATHEARHAATLIAKELGQRVRVKPVMVLYGPSVTWVIMRVKGVDTFDGSRIGTYFRRQTKAVGKNRLNTSQIAMVLAAAARALPPLQ